MIDALMLDMEQTESGIHAVATDPAFGRRVDVCLLHELAHADLGLYRGLLIGLHADQRFLQRNRVKLETFLRQNGVIVFCGHVGHSFLAELAPFEPIADYSVEDLRVCRLAEHPVWAGVDTEDLTWRRGVTGFYGRGANPPPVGAEVIHGLGPKGVPVDFECRPEQGGRLLVHAGVDLWGYVNATNSTRRIVPQLLDWISSVGRRA